MKKLLKKILTSKINFQPIDYLLYLVSSALIFLFLTTEFRGSDIWIYDNSPIVSALGALAPMYIYRLFKNYKDSKKDKHEHQI